MDKWTQASIEYANSRNYLDKLYPVYPLLTNRPRTIPHDTWESVVEAYQERDNLSLIRHLLKLNLFPIKDSYVSYLRRDPSALERNPATVRRLAANLYNLNLEKILEKCEEPKETNRQMGPMFKNWVDNGGLALKPISLKDFEKSTSDAILMGSDAEMAQWCTQKLNYPRNKGLDFVGRFNGTYVIGEAKFLTDFGGHQNAQLEDALATSQLKNVDAITLAILDGVVYIRNSGKMYQTITHCESTVLSALILSDFLATI